MTEESAPDRELLASVRVGMSVVDEMGLPFGTVTEVSRPDPDGDRASDWAAEADYTGREDLTDEEKARYLHLGYLRVDRDSIAGEQLVPADVIDNVSGEVVRLRFAPD